MDQALPCLLRIVAACPPSRLMRVCVTYIKTFPGHGRSPTSNLLDETRVPVITPGTPEANAPPAGHSAPQRRRQGDGGEVKGGGRPRVVGDGAGAGGERGKCRWPPGGVAARGPAVRGDRTGPRAR